MSTWSDNLSEETHWCDFVIVNAFDIWKRHEWTILITILH